MPGRERVSPVGTPAPSHLLAVAAALFAARSFYRLLPRSELTLDTGIGRPRQPLGPVPSENATRQGASPRPLRRGWEALYGSWRFGAAIGSPAAVPRTR